MCCAKQRERGGFSCSICCDPLLDEDERITEMECTHSSGHFHRKCIRKWTETNDQCPICKTEIKIRGDTPWKRWMRQTRLTIRDIDYSGYDEVSLREALSAAQEERGRLKNSSSELIKIHDSHIDIINASLRKLKDSKRSPDVRAEECAVSDADAQE